MRKNRDGALVTIPAGMSLDLDFTQKKLVVQHDSGVLVKDGGRLH